EISPTSLLIILFFGEQVCSKAQIDGCDDCIRSGPSCVWCKQLVTWLW
uniref:Integrin beta N-terminal domain-containing protein n=1 Tax=Neogobius melanostomus TaxID=47308 RepID=A0A8C6V2C8_9GOBI